MRTQKNLNLIQGQNSFLGIKNHLNQLRNVDPKSTQSLKRVDSIVTKIMVDLIDLYTCSDTLVNASHAIRVDLNGAEKELQANIETVKDECGKLFPDLKKSIDDKHVNDEITEMETLIQELDKKSAALAKGDFSEAKEIDKQINKHLF